MKKQDFSRDAANHEGLRNFTIEFRGDYLYIEHVSDFEIAPHSEIGLWSALAVECQTYNCRRVLRKGKPGDRKMNWIDVFDSAVHLTNKIPGLVLACCFENCREDELTRFFKTAASNRGVEINFFSDCREALRWLGVDD